MVRTVDYGARRRAVLAATVNRYIRDAFPVASEDVADEFGLSSATIRNIFSELEEAGFITHPYTSGGRLPTDKGYRYYVDCLISRMELLEEEKERITREYQKKIKRLEDTLEETSEVISAITRYTGIVSLLERQDRLFYAGISYILEQPEFQNLEKMRLLFKMIEDKQRILNVINRDFKAQVKVYIGKEIGCPEMENCSLVVCTYRLNDAPSGRLAVLGPARMQYSRIIPTLAYISDVLSQALEDVI